jgi:hypothetical protein
MPSSALFLLSLDQSETVNRIIHLVNYLKIYLEFMFLIFEGRQQKERKCSLESLINKAQGVSLIRPICQNRVIYLELCCHDPTFETSYTKNTGTK